MDEFVRPIFGADRSSYLIHRTPSCSHETASRKECFRSIFKARLNTFLNSLRKQEEPPWKANKFLYFGEFHNLAGFECLRSLAEREIDRSLIFKEQTPEEDRAYRFSSPKAFSRGKPASKVWTIRLTKRLSWNDFESFIEYYSMSGCHSRWIGRTAKRSRIQKVQETGSHSLPVTGFIYSKRASVDPLVAISGFSYLRGWIEVWIKFRPSVWIPDSGILLPKRSILEPTTNWQAKNQLTTMF